MPPAPLNETLHIVRLAIIVGFHLFPREKLLLNVFPWFGVEVSENVAIVYLWPTCHVRSESIINTVRVIFSRKAYCF